MHRRLLFIFIFSVSSLTGLPQFEISPNGFDAYEDILALRFNEANLKMKTGNVSTPSNVFQVYLENYMDFLSVFISEDEELYQLFNEKKTERIEQLKQLDENTPYGKYLLGNAFLQWAFVEIKFKDYLAAAVDFNRSYQLIEENRKAFPDFAPNHISEGVLSIMVGLVPDNYHWFLQLLSMEGGVDEGRKLILEAYQISLSNSNFAFLKPEALFYLAFVDLNINPERKNIEQLLSLINETDKKNLLLSYLAINMKMRTGQNDSALRQLLNLGERKDHYPFAYLDYLKGECLLRKLDLKDAPGFYNQFINEYRGRNFIKDAFRKQAWAAFLEGDTLTYRQMMEKVIITGCLDVDIDKEAELEASLKEIPNVELLKARLLYDGGYFAEAKNILQNINTQKLPLVFQVEHDYRLARIFHDTGNWEEARLYYEQTMLRGKKLKKYYAGNSALKLGEIYESENNVMKAKEYYEKCLQLEFDEYEASIHSKARAGLERLGN